MSKKGRIIIIIVVVICTFAVVRFQKKSFYEIKDFPESENVSKIELFLYNSSSPGYEQETLISNTAIEAFYDIIEKNHIRHNTFFADLSLGFDFKSLETIQVFIYSDKSDKFVMMMETDQIYAGDSGNGYCTYSIDETFVKDIRKFFDYPKKTL